jgi:hypothetical protein
MPGRHPEMMKMGRTGSRKRQNHGRAARATNFRRRGRKDRLKAELPNDKKTA